MENECPVTPPPELVKQWLAEPEYVSGWNGKRTMISVTDHRFSNICAKAAQWGADQELEACCELVPGLTNYLRDARRSKPPTLKEQALAVLMALEIDEPGYEGTYNTIRRALEQLND